MSIFLRAPRCPLCGREVREVPKECPILGVRVHRSCCRELCPLRGEGFCLGRAVIRLLSQVPLSEYELAERLGVEPARARLILQLLERAGRVERTPEGGYRAVT